jgi:hypothetical protein
MNGFYYVIHKLRDYIKETGFINSVSTGDIFEVDLVKQTIYPLSHIIVNNASPKEFVTSYNISILFMDIVEISKDIPVNLFDNNTNMLDILNDQITIAQRLVSSLKRGDLFNNLIQIDGDPLCEPFTDRFENKVAGWTLTFDIIVPNDMTIC